MSGLQNVFLEDTDLCPDEDHPRPAASIYEVISKIELCCRQLPYRFCRIHEALFVTEPEIAITVRLTSIDLPRDSEVRLKGYDEWTHRQEAKQGRVGDFAQYFRY